MQKTLYTFALLLAASTIFISCSGNNRGVVINGVRWATTNVETPGSFANNPENVGGFFTFEQAQHACPDGWRLPTQQELQLLVDADRGWTNRNGVQGRLFGGLFFPAAGVSDESGSHYNAGTWGYFWSSSSDDADNGWLLWIGSTFADISNFCRTNGISVRCVAE